MIFRSRGLFGVMILLIVSSTVTSKRRQPQLQETNVEGELSDALLISSIENTVSLNELVTELTQQVVDVMLSVGNAKKEVDEIRNSWSQDIETIKGNIEGVKKSHDEEIEKLKKELDRMQAEHVTTTKQVETLRIDTATELDEVKKDISTVHTEQKSIAEKIDELRNEKPRSHVAIVSAEEEGGNPECAKVCAGTTGRETTDTTYYQKSSVYIDVSMQKCGFVKVPTITTSLEGKKNHWLTNGTSSIYNASTNSFRIYLQNTNFDKDDIKESARTRLWNVEWIAVGYTCSK